jgi:Flp pilus assembly protein TadG
LKQSPLGQSGRRLRLARADERGSIAVQTAILLVAVLGFSGLGIEMSNILLLHRKQQSVADSAAMAAAKALGTSDPQTEALAVAAELGFQNGVGGVSVTVANPPSVGAHAGDANYVEVSVQQAVQPVLSSMIHSGSYTVRTRAVGVRTLGSQACLLSLSNGNTTAISLSNNATLNVSQCGVAVNSTGTSAIQLGNNATVNGPVTVAGGVSYGANSSVTGGVTQGATATADPYAGLASLAESGTQRTASVGNNANVTLQPGVYASGWSFGNNANVTLQPGVYWIESGFNIGNNTVISGTGVTLVIDGSYALQVGSNVQLNISAPTSGPTAGVALYSPATNSAMTQSFGNNDVLNVTGAVYFPSQNLSFGNNVTTGASQCTQVVAQTISLSNNASFGGQCTGTGVSQIGNITAAALVE